MIGKIVRMMNKILFPNTCDSESYVKYLISKGAKIGENTRFIAPKKCNVDVARAEYISIGENCCLSMCAILAHDYSWYVMADAYHDVLPDPGGEVRIGNNCFIGYHAIILKDTVIGDNVIIGAGAVVKGKIPSRTVWAGVPAKQICTLDEYYKKRMDSRITDAFKRYEIVERTKKPTINDMGAFSFLFLKRTEENYEKYIGSIEFNGIYQNERLKSEFFNSQPSFEGFEEFVKSYKANVKNDIA